MRTLFQEITEEIIAAIESGAISGGHEMPWHTAGLPRNAATGRHYSGINVLLLWAQARKRGYESTQWATYRQWAELGAQVRKGETSTTVIFWKGFDGPDGDAGEGGRHARFVARAFRLFSADQVDGFEEPRAAPLSEDDRITRAERFFAAFPATIWYGGDAAFYDPYADVISMPDFTAFRSPDAFYSVLGHEAVHWSGANHRLGRDLKNRFGAAAYAMEELVAELGAAFLGAHLDLPLERRQDHAAYISSWLRALRDDPRAIITAASKAQIAVDYLISLSCTDAHVVEEAA